MTDDALNTSPSIASVNLPIDSSMSSFARAPSPDVGSAAHGSSAHGHDGTPATPQRMPAKLPISGPMNGAPIPLGYKFGGKDESTSVDGHGKKDDKKRFWQRFGGDKAKAEYRPIFGVQLTEAVAASAVGERTGLPSVVFRCIEYLEKSDAASEEGIYRLSGSSAVIKGLRDRFNTEGDVDLTTGDQFYDPHAIAGLLKSYLRELPTSVLTRELHMEFLRVNGELPSPIRPEAFFLTVLDCAQTYPTGLTASTNLANWSACFRWPTMLSSGRSVDSKEIVIVSLEWPRYR